MQHWQINARASRRANASAVPRCAARNAPLQLGRPMAAASEGACCTFGPASPAPLPLGTAAAWCASWGGPTSTSCFTKRCRSDTCRVAGVTGAIQLCSAGAAEAYAMQLPPWQQVTHCPSNVRSKGVAMHTPTCKTQLCSQHGSPSVGGHRYAAPAPAAAQWRPCPAACRRTAACGMGRQKAGGVEVLCEGLADHRRQSGQVRQAGAQASAHVACAAARYAMQAAARTCVAAPGPARCR